MTITSPVFSDESPTIPTIYTCDGEAISPPLIFQDVPTEAQSLTLLMEDPDIPRTLRPDGMFNHWVVYNLPASTHLLAEAEPVPGMLGKNTRGDLAYRGPCPPDREHRYIFTLYALDTMLALDPGAEKETVIAAMQGHILDQAQLVGRYDRPRAP